MTFTTIRKLILFTSQVLGILITIYFIINAQNYQIEFNVLTWLFPSWIAKLNGALATIGTYILVIPLTIIALSLLIPESMGLRIASSFFGITSTIILGISGFFNNNLTLVYNMKLFLVKKILTLQEKRDLFSQEFISICDTQYKTAHELYYHLLEHLKPEYFAIYDLKFNLIKDSLEVKLYAMSIIQELILRYNHTKSLEPTYSIITRDNVIFVAKGFLVVAGLLAGVAIIRYIFFDSDAKTIGTGIVDAMEKNITPLIGLSKKAHEGVRDVATAGVDTSVAAAVIASTTVSEATKQAFVNVEVKFTQLASTVELNHFEQTKLTDNLLALVNVLLDNAGIVIPPPSE